MTLALAADFHVNESFGYEEKTPFKKSLDLALCAINDCLSKGDFVLLLGDETDTGRKKEWQAVLGLLRDNKGIVIPGNHDLAFQTPFLSRRRRCFNFYDQVISKYYLHRVVLDGTGKTVDALYTKYLGQIYPDLRRHLIDIFPMIMHNDDEKVIVALNSCTDHGIDMLTNGMGRLGEEQIGRLQNLLVQQYFNKILIIALHHHVVMTAEIREMMLGENTTSLQLKALKLKDASTFWAMIKQLEPHFKKIVILHGHLHKYFEVHDGNVSIYSVPSTENSGGRATLVKI